MTLTYDHNGNLTSDGVFTYAYDGWNRLRKVQRVKPSPTTTDVALYEYLADNRRSEKIVQHSGAEVVENDGGNTSVRFYYGGSVARPPSAGFGPQPPSAANWNILETRNGSDQATFQYVWGTQYVDELVLIDKNLAPENAAGNRGYQLVPFPPNVFPSSSCCYRTVPPACPFLSRISSAVVGSACTYTTVAWALQFWPTGQCSCAGIKTCTCDYLCGCRSCWPLWGAPIVTAWNCTSTHISAAAWFTPLGASPNCRAACFAAIPATPNCPP